MLWRSLHLHFFRYFLCGSVPEMEGFMTAEEVSRNYHISVEKIKYYEKNGLLEHTVLPDGEIEYTEQQIRCAGLIHSLINSGLAME